MTDEATFQAMLDDDPTNSLTRLILADWLEERGDPRAAGYRWLGLNGKWPEKHRNRSQWDWFSGVKIIESKRLPIEWEPMIHLGLWKFFRSRFDAENTFALVYQKLVDKWPDRFALKEHVG